MRHQSGITEDAVIYYSVLLKRGMDRLKNDHSDEIGGNNTSVVLDVTPMLEGYDNVWEKHC